jgi:peptidoglycan/LPS O-acetylase OafA/YrhL
VPVLVEDVRRPTRWPALDGFRGLAVLVVLGYHAVKLVLEAHGLVAPEPTDAELWPLGLGKFAVDAFFVLSGFLIVAAWDRRPEARHFFGRRVRRLWPAYLVSVFVLVPLLAPEVLWSGRDLLALVTLQGYVVEGLTPSINVPWWSLTTEVHFYLLVPLLAPLLHRRFGRWALLAGAVALSLWWWDSGQYLYELPGSLLPGRLTQFLLGGLVGIAVRERIAATRTWTWSLARSRWLFRAAVAALLALGLYLGANGTYHRREVAFDLWIEPLSALLLAAVLLHVVVREEDGGPSRLSSTPLRFAGLVSYSLYLWHYPILAWAVDAMAVDDVPAMAVPAIAIGLAASALVTWVSYRWVERPLLQAGRPTPTRAEQPALVDAG